MQYMAFSLKVQILDSLCPEEKPCHLQWGILQILNHLCVAPGMALGAGRNEASGHGMSNLSIMIWAYQSLIIPSDRPAIIGLKRYCDLA